MFLLWVKYFHVTYCTMFTKWLQVGMSDMHDRRGFGTKQDFIPLFFFMYV